MYDLRLKVNIEESAKSVRVVPIFRQLLEKLAETADAPIAVFDIHGKPVNPASLPGKEAFQKAFGVKSIPDMNRKLALGFKLRTSTWLSWFKSRLMQSFLQPKGLYLRIQTGGFASGIAQDYVGFWMKEFPTHADLPVLTTVLMADVEDYWKGLETTTKAGWTDKHPEVLIDDNIASHVFQLESGRIYGEDASSKMVSTGALKIMAPKKYSAFARFLLDGVVIARKDNPYLVPGALRYEEKTTYYNLLAQQCAFMENHRNIQIKQVSATDLFSTGRLDATIHQMVTSNEHVLRATHNDITECLNISVQKDTYIEVIEWLEEALKTHSFDYSPQVKRTTSSRPLSSTQGSRYSGLFTAAASVNNLSFDPSTISTRRSAWTSRPPVMISYAHEDNEFPPLSTPAKMTPETPDNKSTVNSTAYDDSSFQTLIQESIAKLETQHKKEMDALRVNMEEKLKAVEDKMASLVQTIVEQTYQALAKDDGPLSTRKDHTELKGEVQSLDIKLDRLLDLMQQPASQTHGNNTPTRVQKRQKATSTPPRLEPTAMDTDDPSSSATALPVTEEAEREE